MGELHIIIESSCIVRMANHIDFQSGIFLKQYCYLFQGWFRFRFDISLVEIEMNPIESNMAGCVDPFSHEPGIGNYLLSHGLLFHNG
ncbi:MAG: hypothetical protein BWX92_03973 [Deltaproteobacteria bacterium ADurb.Bin135]|nr:MAG: hypothetical protein BWX92_03973 [Deltaproteobacteria bacterium ADurb.Bin135]